MVGATEIAALAAAVVLGGCAATPSGSPAGGRVLFAQACGACHSVTGRQSPRRQGGDLLRLHIGRATMLEFAREMPVRHRLSSAQLQVVVDYVLAVERRRP